MNEKRQRNDDLQERLIESQFVCWMSSNPCPMQYLLGLLPFITPCSIFHPHGERIAHQYNHIPTRRTRGKYRAL